MNNLSCEKYSGKEKKLAAAVLVIVCLIICLPMGLCPIWNGEIPKHRNQYEVMADSLLNGHLYMDYDDIDPALEEMDNPYDPVERKEKKVKVHKDHAYYNQKYYMYFGIVPVILLFIPYKLITGTTLITYHATQLFTALYIVGLFCLIFQLKKLFFKRLSYSVTLLMAVASTFASTWYIVDAPSLYCTAISSGICCEIWSFFFFIKAVWGEEKENRQIAFAFIGSVFGAAAFGCRPPVALANFMLVPFLAEYLRKKAESKAISVKLWLKLLAAALPYVIIGALLMLYNYVRFDNPFEFGQSYQLTVADQHLYGNLFTNFHLKTVLEYFSECFFKGCTDFPGLFLEFPVLLSCFLIFERKNRRYLSCHHFALSTGFMGATIIAIAFFESLTAPWFIERYVMDILWLCFIMVFCNLGGILCTLEGDKMRLAEKIIVIMAVLAICAGIVLFFVPHDSNFMAYYLKNKT